MKDKHSGRFQQINGVVDYEVYKRFKALCDHKNRLIFEYISELMEKELDNQKLIRELESIEGTESE